MKKIVNKKKSPIITYNKRIFQEYFIEKEFEAGIVLQGWEVKSLRSGKSNIDNSYVVIKNGEAFLLNANFIPITTIATYYVCNPIRTRKLLLNRYELNSLYGNTKREGYTLVVISLFWKHAWCKAKIAIAKGKKKHDKRSVLKDREWENRKERIMKIRISNCEL